MILLSRRTKEAIKTALAMTLAYGIALAMDWDKPYWAAFAVSACSLGSIGQSLNQAAMRMFGTLLAVFVALALLSWAPQDRWLFIMLLSAWVGFCAYRMTGSKRGYFWFVTGFVVVVICFSGGANSAEAFEIAILRLQETGLGILAYSLVMSLLWPENSSNEFHTNLQKLAAVRLRLYRMYLGLMQGSEEHAELDALRAEGVQLQGRVDQLLEAAIIDSYDVWEVRHLWRKFRREAAELAETMERWRHAFSEVRALDLRTLVPGLKAFGDELEWRFSTVESMLSGGPRPSRAPAEVDLELDKDAVQALPYFQQAALVVTQRRLRHLEALSRDIFLTVCDIKGFGSVGAAQSLIKGPRPAPLFDFDRAAAAFRAMLSLWLAYLIWIYTTVPSGTSFITVVGVFGLAVAVIPHVPLKVLVAPLMVAVSFASLVYIFLLPQLSTFMELGTLLFVVTFAITYIFYSPRQALARSIGLAMFVMITGVDNQQTYSFLHVANTAAMLTLGLALLWVVAAVTTSPGAEVAMLRRLRRFFDSCAYLISTPWAPGAKRSLWDRLRRTYHLHEARTLPTKLKPWSGSIDPALPGAGQDNLQSVLGAVQTLSHRVQELVEARELPQSAMLDTEELKHVMTEWRLKLHAFFKQGTHKKVDILQSDVAVRLRTVEAQIESILNSSASGAITDHERENLYRALGAYRSVSEASLDFVRATSEIDWARWREARF